MTFPSLSKSWEFIPNYAIAATGSAVNTNRTFAKWIFDSMTTNPNWVDSSNVSVTPSGLATVDYSCDSVTAGTKGDGVNRIAAIANIVWAAAASPHSWIVLKLYGTAEILFSFEAASVNGNNITIYISASLGFTGGTTTARPTAVDERVVINNTTWTGLSSDANIKCHMLKSTDGESWRIFMGNGGQESTIFIFGKAVPFNAVAWPNSFVMLGIGSTLGTNFLTNNNINATANFNGYGVSGMAMYLAGMAYASTQGNVNVTSANDLSGEWPFMPQQLVSATTSNRGFHGYLSDVWYGSTTMANGSTSPTTGTQHQFVQFGHLIFPWCKIAAVVT